MSINIDSNDIKEVNIGTDNIDSVIDINYDTSPLLGVDLLANNNQKKEDKGYSSGGEESNHSDKSNQEDFNFFADNKISEEKKIPVMPHTAYFGPGFLASLHLASTSNMEIFIERFWLDLAEEFYPGFKTAKNGVYNLPEGPGLGMDINENLISKFKV